MAMVLEVVWQIFVISIITELFIHILPSEKYVSHIRLVGGVFLAYTAIMPVASFIAGEGFEGYADSIKNATDISELKSEMEIYVNEGEKLYISSYEKKYESAIEQLLLEKGFVPEGVEVKLDEDEESDTFGEINIISVKLPDTINADKIYVKKYLTETLKIKSERITVY